MNIDVECPKCGHLHFEEDVTEGESFALSCENCGHHFQWTVEINTKYDEA